MCHVELAAALGFADAAPVRGPVGGSSKARLLDEGFQQHGSVTVARLPVVAEASCGTGQDGRGQIGAVHPGQDQKASVVDN